MKLYKVTFTTVFNAGSEQQAVSIRDAISREASQVNITALYSHISAAKEVFDVKKEFEGLDES